MPFIYLKSGDFSYIMIPLKKKKLNQYKMEKE